MKNIWFTLFCAFVWLACGNEKVTSGFDFEHFSTIDRDSNEIGLSVRAHYKLTSRYLDRLKGKYGRHYNDSLILPVVISVSQLTLREYSAGEIYNYKRQEIEQKLGEQIGIALNSLDLEMDNFFISSVELPDELMRKVLKEHLDRN